jgi:hypothetical protein
MITGRIARLAVGSAVLLVAAALVAGCGAARDGTGGANGSVPAGSTATTITLPEGFPVGTWTTTITAEDLAALDDAALANLGMSRDNLVRENAGVFTLTLGADGSWSVLQKTDVPVRWPIFKGTYSPVGADAFDQLTSFPPDFAGDVVRFGWRTADGKLLLTVSDPPDPILPIVIGAHPWSPAG